MIEEEKVDEELVVQVLNHFVPHDITMNYSYSSQIGGRVRSYGWQFAEILELMLDLTDKGYKGYYIDIKIKHLMQ